MRAFNGLSAYLADTVATIGIPSYRVADVAPNTHTDLLQCYRQTGRLVIWSGGSDRTIWGGCADNYRFRAWHDWCHIASGMCDKVDCFTVDREIELADIQCVGISSGLARVVQIEIAEQARHYGKSGTFVTDQIAFTLEKLSLTA